MLQVYDKKSPVTFPSGRTLTFKELKNEPQYTMLVNSDCAIDVTDGVTFSILPIAMMKRAFGIEGDTPEEVVQKYEEKMAQQEEQNAKDQATVDDIQAQMDALCGIES